MAANEGRPDMRRSPLMGAVVMLVLIGFLVAAAGAAWYLWADMQDTPIGTHGVIALTLGGGVAVLLGAG